MQYISYPSSYSVHKIELPHHNNETIYVRSHRLYSYNILPAAPRARGLVPLGVIGGIIVTLGVFFGVQFGTDLE